jgi:t-SNARE complex subunit (syntaxin)
MTDRLRDLKRGGQTTISIDGGAGDKEVSTGLGSKLLANDTMARSSNASQQTAVTQSAQFFKDVDVLKAKINVIKDATTKITDLTQEAILATSNEKESELSAEIQPVIEESNKAGQNTKKLLQLLKEQTSQMTDQQEVKIRENLLNTLTRKFVEVMKSYQAAQTKYKTEITKKAKRQVQMVKPNATAEEVDAVVRSGGADQLIQQQILKGQASESVRTMFESVNQKHNEILQIEKSVQEMHQMFLDLALVVDSQGEMLDSIEFQVKQSLEFIEEGNEQMQQAIQIQKNIRKRQAWCCLAILVLIGIIVLYVVLKGKATGS